MKHLRRTVVFISSLFAITACETVLGPPGSEAPFLTTVPSPPFDVIIEGEPNINSITINGGYYIWKVGGLWHMRVAKINVPRFAYPRDVFVGSIRVENGFITSGRQTVTFPDEIRVGVSDIFFRFEVDRAIEGLDFSIRPAVGFEYCVSVDVQINGLMNPELVHLGRSMFTPNALPIGMCFRQ